MKKLITVLLTILLINLSCISVFADGKGVNISYTVPAKVTFEYENTENLVLEYKLGEKITEQSHEEKTGFIFEGWYYNDGSTDIKWDFDNQLSESHLKDGLTLTLFQKYVNRDTKIFNDTKPSDNDFSGTLTMKTSDITLTEEESNELLSGKTMNIVLKVKDITDSVGSTDKKKLEDKADEIGEKVLFYLDITLTKQISNGSVTNITSTSGKVTITITVPEEYYKENRVYSIIRLHNGNSEVLFEGKANSKREISFETDCFSVYAIAFKDVYPGYDVVNTGIEGLIQNISEGGAGKLVMLTGSVVVLSYLALRKKRK